MHVLYMYMYVVKPQDDGEAFLEYMYVKCGQILMIDTSYSFLSDPE